MKRASKPGPSGAYSAWGGFIEDNLHIDTIASTRRDCWIEVLHLLSAGDREMFDLLTSDQDKAIRRLRDLGWAVRRILIKEAGSEPRGAKGVGASRPAAAKNGSRRGKGPTRTQGDRR